LHFKGFDAIGGLDEYTGVRVLWLEGNGIRKIDNLEHCTELRCLYLQQNCLHKIENLDALVELDALNVSNNMIEKIENLDKLTKLHTLQIANNLLKATIDIAEIVDCPSISVLDLSNNTLDDPSIVEILERLPNLAVLTLTGNPVIPKISMYRKTMVARLKALTYLDDRPVFEEERRTSEAWFVGGPEAENEMRQRIRDEKQEYDRRNFEALERLALGSEYLSDTVEEENTPALDGLSSDDENMDELQEDTNVANLQSADNTKPSKLESNGDLHEDKKTFLTQQEESISNHSTANANNGTSNDGFVEKDEPLHTLDQEAGKEKGDNEERWATKVAQTTVQQINDDTNVQDYETVD